MSRVYSQVVRSCSLSATTANQVLFRGSKEMESLGVRMRL